MNKGCDPTARTDRTRSAQSESGAAACPRVARMVLARSKSRVILSSSAGWVSPSAGNLSTTQAVATQRWTTTGGAVIKGHDGTWYLAIRTRKLARAEDFIVSLGGEKGGEIAAEVTEKDLYDTTGKGRLLYEKIIFGCVGGVFHAADGVRSARVKACIASENGDSVARLRFVHWRTAADNEKGKRRRAPIAARARSRRRRAPSAARARSRRRARSRARRAARAQAMTATEGGAERQARPPHSTRGSP